MAPHRRADISRANISPRKRDRILAKYAPVQPRDPTSGLQAGSARRPQRVSDTDPNEVLAARCPGCGFTYEVAAGCEHEGFAAGTAWNDIPDDWCCPDCGVREKVDFVVVEPAEVG